MQGHPDVIACLNALLTRELSAIDQYVVQAYMLENWGYQKLYERIAHETDDERGHVVKLVRRILFLDGMPDVASRLPLDVGKTPKEMLESDLKLELQVANSLNEAMALCRDKGDNGTRAVLEELLNDTERDHIYWLQQQLHLIDEVGIQEYLAEKI